MVQLYKLKFDLLQEIMKGGYIPAHPEEGTGESSPWYASFWGFCAAYLKKRFGTNWSLSPEQSLMNVMLAAGGYPWTIIPFDKRADYMNSLEIASVKQDIEPLALFLGGLVSDSLSVIKY